MVKKANQAGRAVSCLGETKVIKPASSITEIAFSLFKVLLKISTSCTRSLVTETLILLVV
jgi:hypothetical protein